MGTDKDAAAIKRTFGAFGFEIEELKDSEVGQSTLDSLEKKIGRSFQTTKNIWSTESCPGCRTRTITFDNGATINYVVRMQHS